MGVSGLPSQNTFMAMNDRPKSRQEKAKDRDGRVIICYNCQKPGHFKKDCRSKSRGSFPQSQSGQERGFRPQRGFNPRGRPRGLDKDDNSGPENKTTDKGKETFEGMVETTDAEDEEVTMADARISTMS